MEYFERIIYMKISFGFDNSYYYSYRSFEWYPSDFPNTESNIFDIIFERIIQVCKNNFRKIVWNLVAGFYEIFICLYILCNAPS